MKCTGQDIGGRHGSGEFRFFPGINPELPSVDDTMLAGVHPLH